MYMIICEENSSSEPICLVVHLFTFHIYVNLTVLCITPLFNELERRTKTEGLQGTKTERNERESQASR